MFSCGAHHKYEVNGLMLDRRVFRPKFRQTGTPGGAAKPQQMQPSDPKTCEAVGVANSQLMSAPPAECIMLKNS